MPNPVAGGSIGRTDMGVDISGTPGATITDPVPGTSRLVGRIADWYKGQPLYVWLVTNGPFKGKFWYDAEQVTAPPSSTVAQGQPIGQIASSGTGTEWGWAAGASGQTLAQATTGYSEGQVTSAGTDFLNRIIKAAGGRSRAVALNFQPCLLTWYDPALGGINGGGLTANGEQYSTTAMTCAAPPQYAFGTMITFRYQGKTVTCRVNDRGGAIQGDHFDLARLPAQKLGVISAGSVNAEFAVGGAGGTSSAGYGGSRPTGAPVDTGAQVEKELSDYVALRDMDRSTGGSPGSGRFVSTAAGKSPSDFLTNFIGAAMNVFGGGQ